MSCSLLSFRLAKKQSKTLGVRVNADPTAPKIKRNGFVFDFLEDKLSPSSMFGMPTTIVYSDPTAPAEPDPGPYPGDRPPVDYPTPVPGGPVGGPGFEF